MRRFASVALALAFLPLPACGPDVGNPADGGYVPPDGTPVDSQACAADADCASALLPVCALGVCSGCASNADCHGQASGSICAPSGACVECNASADCPGETPLCDAAGRCVECERDDTCPIDAPACVLGNCRRCDDDGVACSGAQSSAFLANELCVHSLALESDVSGASGLAAFCSGRARYLGEHGMLLDGVANGRVLATPELLREFATSIQSSGIYALVPGRGFVGTVSNGSFCRSSFDCAEGFCDTTLSCAGTCAGSLPPTCSTSADCPGRPNAVCLSGECATLPIAGEGCTVLCAPGLRCNTTSDLCESARGMGEACSNGFDCALGLACVSGHCESSAPEGGTCTSARVCADRRRCIGGTCVSRAADGVPGSCSTTNDCLSGSRCVGSTCRLIARPGESCGTSGSVCAVGTGCRAGRCVRLPDIGEPCGGPVPSLSCLRGHCSVASPDFGTCIDSDEGDPCIYTEPLFNDVLDSCGDGLACVPTSEGDRCSPDGHQGTECTGAFAAPCSHVGAYCDANEVCQERCHAE